MKTTILLIAFGLASTITFAQQSGGKATAGSSSAIETRKVDVKSSASGSAGAAISSDAPGKAAKKTVEVAQKTKTVTETWSVNGAESENSNDKKVLSAGSANNVMAKNADGETIVTGNGEATLSSDQAGKAAKKTAEVVQNTKATAEGAINGVGNRAKDVVNNTNAFVSLQATSSSEGAVNTSNKDNNALSVKHNSAMMLEKEIKGENIVKAEQKLENTAVNGLQKTDSRIKAGSAKAQSDIKSNTQAVSGTAVSAKSSTKTMLKSKPVKAAVNTKTITGVKIR